MTLARGIQLVGVLVAGAVLVLAGAPHEQPASASAPHRAAVVVDLGDGHVKVGCVSFTEDHLTGLEALDRAAMAPVAQTYGGQGSAVCALCGKGCSAGSTCLTCKAPNYWAYYHHGTYSPAGAGRTEVRDGDTEAWKWGKGERPAAISFAEVCPVPGPKPTASPTTRPPATAPRTTQPASPTSALGASGGSGPETGGGSGPSAGAGSPTTASGPGSSVVGSTAATTATTSPTATTDPSSTAPTSSTSSVPGKPSSSRGEQSAASIARRPLVVERAGAKGSSSAARSPDRGAGTVVSIATFAGVIVLVTGLIVVLRRRRVATG